MNDALYGHYTNTRNSFTEEGGLLNGELVRCMFLDHGFPRSYENEIAEKNKIEVEEANTSGLPFIPIKPSHKDGGLNYRFVVIARSAYLDASTNKWILGQEPDKFLFKELVLPDIKVFGEIEQLTPPQIYDKGWNTQKKGAGSFMNKGFPSVIDLLPDAKPAKNYDTGITVNSIPDGMEEQYKYLIALESDRQVQWQGVLDFWNSVDEDKAFGILEDGLARRLGLCRWNEKEEVYEFLKPCKGMTFTSRIYRKEGSSFFNLGSFAWNFEARRHDWFTDFNVTEPNAKLLNFADELIRLRDNESLIRAEKKASKVSSTDEDLDDCPF